MRHPFPASYLRMAKAAKELQDAWTPRYGDWVMDDDEERLTWVVPEWIGPAKEALWLPLVHQLLALLRHPKPHPMAMDPAIPADQVGDWHTYLLARVMREKHGKIWTGEEWTKADAPISP